MWENPETSNTSLITGGIFLNTNFTNPTDEDDSLRRSNGPKGFPPENSWDTWFHSCFFIPPKVLPPYGGRVAGTDTAPIGDVHPGRMIRHFRFYGTLDPFPEVYSGKAKHRNHRQNGAAGFGVLGF